MERCLTDSAIGVRKQKKVTVWFLYSPVEWQEAISDEESQTPKQHHRQQQMGTESAACETLPQVPGAFTRGVEVNATNGQYIFSQVWAVQIPSQGCIQFLAATRAESSPSQMEPREMKTANVCGFEEVQGCLNE